MLQILSELKEQGYDQDSHLTQQEIKTAFDKVISSGMIERQFPRQGIQEVWQMTLKNDDDEVRLQDFVENMEKKNKLQYLPDRKSVNDKSPTTGMNQNVNRAEDSQPRIQQYEDNSKTEGRNGNINQTISQNINATVAESLGDSEPILIEQRQPQQINQDKSPRRSKPKSKKIKPQTKEGITRPLLHYQSQQTQQQLEDELLKGIPRPEIKSAIRHKSKSKKLKSTNIGSVNHQTSKSLLSTEQSRGQYSSVIDKESQEKQKKCISKRWLIPMCLFIVGLIIFMSSFIIHSQLKKLAIQQVILGPQNQGMWAHFPGDTKAEIDRNWTFFNITNADNMLFYNEKPRFRELQGYKIIEQQDYLNITYIQDGDRVQMVDWLHFIDHPETRNLDQKVKVLNVGGLAYWYNIKIARPTIILQQGLGLLFTTLEDSILANIYAQAIHMQFLSQFTDDIYSTIFSPAFIPFDEAVFVWDDPAYGIGKQDNLKYWLDAISTTEEEEKETVSEGFLFLKSYFTLTTEQLNFIIAQLKTFVEFTKSAVLDNSYCQNVGEECSGRYLAYQQFAVSYVTRNPPPGKDVPPTDTICLSNSTCAGYFPQLQAFYRNVYLVRNPEKNSTLTFEPNWMKDIVNYNKSIDRKYNYSTAENCLFHIGNLDALWDNGTLYDEAIKGQQQQQNVDSMESKYLKNIQERFGLPSTHHAHAFWEWIKYLSNEVILRNQTNERLGVANLFSTGLYQGFAYLQDNLQKNLLAQLIQHDLISKGDLGDCAFFLHKSLQLPSLQTALHICDKYGQKIEKQLIVDLLQICSSEYREQWWTFKNIYKLSTLNLLSLCDPEHESETSFGYLLHAKRKYLNDKYKCDITPKEYCSDYELAAMQWAGSKVTLNPPQQLVGKYPQKTFTYKEWDSNASRFEYSFYTSKYPEDNTFPNITVKQAYGLLNFDNWFSASVMLKQFVDEEFNSRFKEYMRFVGIEVGLNGLTMERSVRELIFGYEDDILKGIKQAYPPFGGDPSTPSKIAFNDPNIEKEQATMTLQWSTGKYNSSLAGQYRKINGLQYLTIPKDFFNGNVTTTTLQSPWEGEDYVYGTSAKMFAPNQFDQPNISLYVPNIQRYGSGVIDQDSVQQRFGFDLQLGYLGDYIYYSTQESDINKKYYQNFHAIFNQTSVVGFPLFVCKNHFMNVTANWSSLVEIYNQDETIHYENSSIYDDSFVVVEPYTGVSFQSTVYLQSNYYHTHDALLTFYNESLLPIFSLARSGNITEEVANNLLGPLKMGLAVVKWTKIIGIVIVVMSALTCGVIYFQKKRLDKKQEQMRSDRSSAEEQQRQKEQHMITNRVIKSSQLGISLQPMTSKDLIRQSQNSQNQYIPPPVVEEQI